MARPSPKASADRRDKRELLRQIEDESVRPLLGVVPLTPGSFSKIALGRAEIEAANLPAAAKRIGDAFSRGKPFSEQAFKTTVNVRVALGGGLVFDDAVKGLSAGHALWRAALNWPGAQWIQRIGK